MDPGIKTPRIPRLPVYRLKSDSLLEQDMKYRERLF
jgi:hypothetical protein